MKNVRKGFNEGFWTFAHIVSRDIDCLNRNGKMIKSIIEFLNNNERLTSITNLARRTNIDISTTQRICRKLERKGYIVLTEAKKNKIIITLNNCYVDDAMKLPRKLIEEFNNEY